MKKPLFAVFVFALLGIALALSGCANLVAPTCTEDNFCSLEEKTRGNCKDCMPDLEIQQDSLTAYYDQSSGIIHAQVCVENKNGEYTDGVLIAWALSSSKEYKGEYNKEWVYFDAPDVSGSFSLNAKKGGIDQWANLQFGNVQDQVNCFSHDFYDVQMAPYYYVNFNVNDDRKVEEKSYDNNYQWLYTEGKIAQFPGYLLDEDFGNLKFSSSYSYQYEWYVDAYNQEPYTFYNSYYTDASSSEHGSSYATAGVYEFASEKVARNIIVEWLDNSYKLETNSDGTNYYVYTSLNTLVSCQKDGFEGLWIDECPEGYSQMDKWKESYDLRYWVSGSKLVYVTASNVDLDVTGLYSSYLNLHPNTFVKVNKTSSLAQPVSPVITTNTPDNLTLKRNVSTTLSFKATDADGDMTRLWIQVFTDQPDATLGVFVSNVSWYNLPSGYLGFTAEDLAVGTNSAYSGEVTASFDTIGTYYIRYAARDTRTPAVWAEKWTKIVVI